MFGWGRPELERECGCGSTHSSICNQVGLGNHFNFPAFAYLPEENDIDEAYYRLVPGTYSYSPRRHWVFVGEICEDRSDFIRHRVLLETKFGETVHVNFHLDDQPDPAFFRWSDLKVGRTMMVMYPYSRTFMDMNRGIRLEYSKTIMVFPAPLTRLSEICERIHQAQDSNSRRCFGCGKDAMECGQALQRCSRCGHTLYCSKQCQAKDWKQDHMRLCKHMKMLTNLIKLDFAHFQGHLDWNFVPERIDPETRGERERQSMFEFIRRSGGEPLSKPKRLLEVLESCQTERFTDSSILKRLLGQVCTGFFQTIWKDLPMSTQSLGEVPLFKHLVRLVEQFDQDIEERVIVTDLRGGDSMGEQVNDALLSLIFFALPQFQVALGINSISWAVEVHHYWESMALFPSSRWHVAKDSCGFIAKNNSSVAFYHDELQVVDDISHAMAVNNPEDVVVRVLRATGARPGITNVLDEICRKESPSNLLTLWLREDVSGSKYLRPLDPNATLFEQITDFDLSGLQRLLGGHDYSE